MRFRAGAVGAAIVLGSWVFPAVQGLAYAQVPEGELLSEANIRDAILGRIQLSDIERETLDLNGDGLLDTADLVFFLKSTGSFTPIASFETATSRALEGSDTATVRVVFSRQFTGTLHYSVTPGLQGEAIPTADADYAALSGTVEAAGLSVDIVIPLLDDAEIEPGESLRLHLDLADGYAVGGGLDHTVYIMDNDGTWVGFFETNGTRLNFRMTIVQSPTGFEGTLEGDGHGFLPEGQFPATITLSGERLVIGIDGIPLSSGLSSLGTTFSRSFEFVADPSGPLYALDLGLLIVGTATETVEADDPAFHYLGWSNAGIFLLAKVPGAIPAPDLVLEAVAP